MLLQATQPVVDTGITWDKITGFVLALTGLVTAIAALLKTGTIQGAVKAVSDRVEAQSRNNLQLRSDLTHVALNTQLVTPPAEPEGSPAASLSGFVNPAPYSTPFRSDRPKP